MKTFLIGVLSLTMIGCAPLREALPGGAAGRENQAAEELLRAGKYAEARDALLRIAREQAGSEAGERAAFQAARLLVSPKNTARDYRQAAREFDAYLRLYPQGKNAADAEAWLGTLEMMEQSRVTELIEQVNALTNKLAVAAGERAKGETEQAGLIRDRDALARERDELKARIDDLAREKEGLLQEKTALLRERDGMVKDKAALENKANSLIRDRERLLAAKARLEQRLRDVTEVDVNMEKKRRKMK